MIAILTKYLGPTNFRGSRVVASTSNGHRHIQDWDDGVNSDNNHESAAHNLAMRMKWLADGRCRLVGGATADGMAFVFVENAK